jgi:hypothetical protein
LFLVLRGSHVSVTAQPLLLFSDLSVFQVTVAELRLLFLGSQVTEVTQRLLFVSGLAGSRVSIWL